MPLLANGERIAELRDRRAWTAAELAERIGTTANYLTQVERGHRNGSKKFIRRAAAALDVEIEDISRYRAPRPRRQQDPA